MTRESSIRRYRPADKNVVWRVHERAFRAVSIPFDPELDRDLRRVPEAYLREGELLVGTTDGQVVAVGGFRPTGDRSIEVKRMRVDPDYQRAGCGSALLRELERRARERGAKRVVLHTSDRLDSAVAFYRTQGYRETSREPHPEIDMALVYFEKRLEMRVVDS
jgi:ribosomal protein S18 acetylase RimI-like enzyme